MEDEMKDTYIDNEGNGVRNGQQETSLFPSQTLRSVTGPACGAGLGMLDGRRQRAGYMNMLS